MLLALKVGQASSSGGVRFRRYSLKLIGSVTPSARPPRAKAILSKPTGQREGEAQHQQY